MAIILEKSDKYMASYDLSSKLLQSRKIFITGGIDEYTAHEVNSQLMYLSSKSKEPITIYINSPGGSVYDGFGIYDMMQLVKKDCIIKTVCLGIAASMGAFLLLGGSKGHRSATKNSTVMLHQPLMGAAGQVSEVEITYKEGQRLKDLINDIIKENTNITNPEKELDRDTWMNAKKAEDLGVIDNIIE